MNTWMLERLPRAIQGHRVAVRCAVAVSISLMLVQPSHSEYIDNRVDSMRAALRDVISAASGAGNLWLQHWGEQNLELINRVFQGATEQQSTFFTHLDDQREGILKGIEASISEVASVADAQTYQLKGVITGFEDSIVRVSRASHYPFVISHSPTYILPARLQDDILFSVTGSYLNNAEPELMVDRKQTPTAVNFQEAALTFRIPRSLLPPPTTTI